MMKMITVPINMMKTDRVANDEGPCVEWKTFHSQSST